MENFRTISLLLFLKVVYLSTTVIMVKCELDLKPCKFPAIYNFGDSNSDTGGMAAAFFPMAAPSGETFFGRPAGRASDGRLIIDFIAEHLELPHLSAYLDTVGTRYRHGANFATGGATIRRPNTSWFQSGASPFPLDIQVEHFTQFKERTAFFFSAQGTKHSDKNRLPRPRDFSKALYTFDIGQNDIASIYSMSTQQFFATVPDTINIFAAQIRDLYGQGARAFWIHNTGPIGCLPVAAGKVENPEKGYVDENGCIKYQNDAASEFNTRLKDKVIELRAELPGASLVYVDMYTAKYELIANARNQGFEGALSICCGYHDVEVDVWCGNKGNINGNETFAGSCSRPSRVISWDGVHYTEAANHWIANRILNGSLSDPPLPIAQACRAALMA